MMISVRRLRWRPASVSLSAIGFVFAAAACRESCGVDSEIILKRLHHRRCAQSGEVPVIAYVDGARDGDIVGIAFHEHIIVVSNP